MKDVEIIVGQGIGDIFWVYQKFSPHVKSIRFLVQQTPGQTQAIASRADPFLRLLPKVKDVIGWMVPGNEYTETSRRMYSMDEILRDGEGTYFCNAALERGIFLDDIDPGVPLERGVAMGLSHQPGLPPEYIALYVSFGCLMDNGSDWPVHKWVEFVKLFYKRFDLKLPLVILGAGYDRIAEEQIFSLLPEMDKQLHIDLPADKVVDVLKRSSYFLCYQSGLGILADDLDVPQIMLYHPLLENMMYCWCKPRKKQIFEATAFSKSPQEVVERILWTPSPSKITAGTKAPVSGKKT